MNRIVLGMVLAAFSAAGFAGNCSTHSKPMVSASDALKIEELQAGTLTLIRDKKCFHGLRFSEPGD